MGGMVVRSYWCSRLTLQMNMVIGAETIYFNPLKTDVYLLYA
jgi:hypothetical protein